MRNLTEQEKSALIENQKRTEETFKAEYPDKEMSPFIYYVPEEYMHFLMAKNNGIPPKTSKEFPFIDDLLPLPEEYKSHQYLIVVNGVKYVYDFPVEGEGSGIKFSPL